MEPVLTYIEDSMISSLANNPEAILLLGIGAVLAVQWVVCLVLFRRDK